MDRDGAITNARPQANPILSQPYDVFEKFWSLRVCRYDYGREEGWIRCTLDQACVQACLYVWHWCVHKFIITYHVHDGTAGFFQSGFAQFAQAEIANLNRAEVTRICGRDGDQFF